jgi:hypothetical protein
MNTSHIGAVAALTLASSGVAMAGSVQMAFSGTGISKAVTVNINGDRLNVRAGQLFHNVNTPSNTTGVQLASQILTYCTDLTQNTNNSMTDYSLVQLASAPQPGQEMGPTAAQNLSRLYAYEMSMEDNAFSSTASSQRTAAFQIAIWEIVADSDNGPLDASSGEFFVEGGLNGVGEALLTQFLAAALNHDGRVSLKALVSQNGQDQIIVVPLPTASAMALAGLAGVVGVRRRR